MNKKENIGYQKTHQRIKDCLLTLLDEYEMKEITISRLCMEVKINRSTFYAHFMDIYDVLEQIEKELEQELFDVYDQQYERGSDLISSKYVIIMMDHIQKNQKFYRALFSDSSINALDENMKMLYESIFKELFERIGLTERQGMFYFIYFKAGFLAILRQWLKDDCPETPEELARILTNSMPESSVNLLTFN